MFASVVFTRNLSVYSRQGLSTVAKTGCILYSVENFAGFHSVLFFGLRIFFASGLQVTITSICGFLFLLSDKH